MASKITKGILISCWIVYLAILGAVVMVFMAIANGSIGYMPPVEQLENPIDTVSYTHLTLPTTSRV